jgi:GH24 family phage-related lysozyme (muramidase)
MHNFLSQDQKIQKIYELIALEQYNTKNYKQKRFELISHSEGFKPNFYSDIFNNKTIGYGFNLDQKNAKQIWLEVFKGKKDFDEILKKNEKINTNEGRELMDYILDKNQGYIQNDYKECWLLLPSDIKVSIESSYYNCPKIVNKYTKFNQNINKYISTNDISYLLEAYYELNFRSNPTKSNGIKNRRINDTPTWIIDLLNKY